MPVFEMTEPTYAKLASVTPRTEMHGDEEVPAVSLSIEIETANTLLDLIDPSIRQALYVPKPDDTPELPGVPESTPVLRCNSIDRVKLTTAHEGWTLHVHHSVDDAVPPWGFGGTKVDNMTVEAKQGGSIVLRMRLGTSDVDADRMGWLCVHKGQEITLALKAPEKPVEAIDGTVGHPGLAALQEGQQQGAEADAGGMFAAAHGDDDSGPEEGDEGDSEGGETATPRRGRRSRSNGAGALPH